MLDVNIGYLTPLEDSNSYRGDAACIDLKRALHVIAEKPYVNDILKRKLDRVFDQLTRIEEQISMLSPKGIYERQVPIHIADSIAYTSDLEVICGLHDLVRILIVYELDHIGAQRLWEDKAEQVYARTLSYTDHAIRELIEELPHEMRGR